MHAVSWAHYKVSNVHIPRELMPTRTGLLHNLPTDFHLQWVSFNRSNMATTSTISLLYHRLTVPDLHPDKVPRRVTLPRCSPCRHNSWPRRSRNSSQRTIQSTSWARSLEGSSSASYMTSISRHWPWKLYERRTWKRRISVGPVIRMSRSYSFRTKIQNWRRVGNGKTWIHAGMKYLHSKVSLSRLRISFKWMYKIVQFLTWLSLYWYCRGSFFWFVPSFTA